jgi:hypothetical protein
MSRYSERDTDRGSRRSREEDDDQPRRRSREEDEPRSRSRGRDEDDDRGSRSRSRDDDRGGRRSRDDDDDDRGSRRSSGSSSGYSYERRDPEATKRRSQRGNTDFDKYLDSKLKTFKVNAGDNRVRILPPTWKGADHYGLDLYVHYGVGADRQTYICPNKQNGAGLPCPICEERARARDDGDDEYAKELEPKRRTLVYVVDRDKPKEGVQAWAMPWTLDNDIIKVSQDKGTGQVLEIDHPEEGFDVEFEKNGTGLKTKYEGVAIARRESPLGKAEWLDYAMDNPLLDQLVIFSYDDIAKSFGAKTAQRSSRRDDDEDRPRGRGRDDDRDSRSSRRPERDDDDRGSRSRGDDRGSRGRNDEPEEPTWESVHEMTKSELEDLIEDKDLDINPKDAKDTEDLADWICEEMKLKKSERRERVKDDEDRPRGRGRDDDDDKLGEMRRRRESDDEDRPRRRRED